MEESDLKLILLWQSGDDHAFEKIYKKYSIPLLRIGMSKTGSRALAEELVQEVFLSLLKNKKTADGIHSLIAYLTTVLKHKILDNHRHMLTHKKYENQVIHTFNEADYSTQLLLETKDFERTLANYIEQLPPKCRNVFKLSRQNHLANKEIANHLKISENTVEQHMRKALRILRGSLIHLKDLSVLVLAFIFHQLH